jgi:hypothetical protein
VTDLATYRFLSWVQGGVAALLAHDDFTTATPARGQVEVAVTVTGGPTPASGRARVAVQGPGDVIGIDPAQIVRAYPRDLTSDAETTHFPLIEFDRPDFPWLFTPASAGGNRLRPWVCLIVVEQQPGVTLTPATPLPILTIGPPATPARELPDLAGAWLWAHAQVIGGPATDTAAEVQQALTVGDPRATLSRLVAPRQLHPQTAYLACLVPSTAVGVAAGLGQDVDPAAEQHLLPAWDAQALPDTIRLPVYHSFTFGTGLGGDFETLARRLQPWTASPASQFGTRPMDIGNPGAGLPSAPTGDPQAVVRLSGALRAVGTQTDPWPLPPADGPDPSWQQRLQDSIRAEVDAPAALRTAGAPPSSPPTVAPPLYGQWHAATQTLEEPNTPAWLGELNLDPRNRAVAGIATQVVRADQEQLMASAWAQLGEVEKANRLLRRAQLARAAAQRLNARHLTPMGDGDLVGLTMTVHQRVLYDTGTVASRLAESALPPGGAWPSLRKGLRPAGRLARLGTGSTTTRTSDQLIQRLADQTLDLTVPPIRPDGTTTFADPVRVLGPQRAAELRSQVAGLAELGGVPLPDSGDAASDLQGLVAGLSANSGLVAAAVTSLTSGQLATTRLPDQVRLTVDPGPTVMLEHPVAFSGPTAGLPPLGGPSPLPAPLGRLPPVGPALLRFPGPVRTVSPRLVPGPGPGATSGGSTATIELAGSDATVTTLWSAVAASTDQTIVAGDAPTLPARPVLAAGSVAERLRDRLDPAVTFTARMANLIRWDVDLGERPDPLATVLAAPSFPRPMYEALRDLSQDLLVPGLQLVPPNAITLLETNPVFVEAYLLGLNHEMARELLWRAYPTDQRGTYFRRFWGEPGVDDIQPIPAFGSGQLGSHVQGGATPRLVLLLRGDLLRRYPGALVYMARASAETAGVPDLDAAADIHLPIFRGLLEPDVTFVGFDLTRSQVAQPPPGTPGWWIVIAEQPTEPRFGFEDLSAASAGSGPEVTAWSELTWQTWGQRPGGLGESYAPLVPPAGLTLQQPAGITWGTSAAGTAHITFRMPVRIALRAADVLPGGAKAPPALVPTPPPTPTE